jgi:hypothetical protein
MVEASLSMGERRFRKRKESMESLRAATRAAFDATWKVDVVFQKRTARSALQETLTVWGLGLNRLDGAEVGLDRRISLRLEGVSRFEVVKAICR